MQNDSRSGSDGQIPDLPITEITELVVPRFSEDKQEAITALLEKHGCCVRMEAGNCTITFPAITKRREIYPRTAVERYSVALPDGFVLMYLYDPHQGLNILFLPVKF